MVANVGIFWYLYDLTFRHYRFRGAHLMTFSRAHWTRVHIWFSLVSPWLPSHTQPLPRTIHSQVPQPRSLTTSLRVI
jgi:hypothetical protein